MKDPELEAVRWLRQAQSDMEVVKTLIVGKHYAQACFYSQQVAEKALKAVLYSQGSRMVFGHSVQDLSRQCIPFDPEFSQVISEAALLDQFYIATRYPNGLPAPAIPSETFSLDQAESAQKAAEHILGVANLFLKDHRLN
jgi:HEPN domain-containing protein